MTDKRKKDVRRSTRWLRWLSVGVAMAGMITLNDYHVRYQDRLPMWVIYRPMTRDYPGEWVIRMHLTLPVHIITRIVVTYPTLDAARDGLPLGLTNIGRQPDDDPVIEEVWL